MSDEEIKKIDAWIKGLSQEAAHIILLVIRILKTFSELSGEPFNVPYEALEKSGLDKRRICLIIMELWRKEAIELVDHTEGNCFSDWKMEREDDNSFTEVTMIYINIPSFEYLYQKLNQNQPNNPKKIRKKDLEKTINQVIKIVKGGKEKKLLQVLSDFKPHKRSELVSKTGYPVSLNSLSQMKIKLNGVLTRNGFYISTEPPVGFLDPTGFYRLKQLIDSK